MCLLCNLLKLRKLIRSPIALLISPAFMALFESSSVCIHLQTLQTPQWESKQWNYHLFLGRCNAWRKNRGWFYPADFCPHVISFSLSNIWGSQQQQIKVETEKANVLHRHRKRAVCSQCYQDGCCCFATQVMLTTKMLLQLIYLCKVIEFRNNLIQVD